MIRAGQTQNSAYGGIWIWGQIVAPLQGVIEGNRVLEPVKHTVTATENVPDTVILRNNVLDKPGPGGQRISLRNQAAPTVEDNNQLLE